MLGNRSSLVFGLTLLGAFQIAPANAALKVITTDLQPQLVVNSVMDMADQLGYFKKEGVDVELVRVQATPSAVAALQSGEGDMANISTDSALQLVARNQLPIKAVMTPMKSLPYTIVTKTVIGSVKDIEDKSFGVARVGSLDYSLSVNVLRSMGANIDKINFVSIGQPDVRAKAITAGQIDSTSVSIGVWMSIPDKNGLKVLVDQDAFYKAAPVISKVNVVTDKVLQGKRADVEAFMRAIMRASRDFAKNPKLWVDAMVKARPDVDRGDLEKLAEAFKGQWSVNGGLNRKELEFTVDWTYQSPDFKDLKKPAIADWVDFGPLDAALKAIGTDPSADTPVR